MDIKVEIALSSTTLELENEDIISLYTSFRSTSKPSEPTYGAFASDGSIVIRDNNLDLFKRAQNGEFDKFNYPVTISLKNEETGDFEAISTQIINRRPIYNYADKTLSIQLSDKIDSMDNLVYEGYPYNLEAETAYDIILDLLTKFWNGTKALACLSANAYGTTTFASIFQDITIQYPYIAPQTTYRAAFSSVLSLAHCALICDENGNPRLIFLDKTTAQVEDTEVAVLTADKTQEAFTTSVILDNKFDNAQIQATNVTSKIETGEVVTLHYEDFSNANISNEDISYNTNGYVEDIYTYGGTASAIQGGDLYYKILSQTIEINEYLNNKLVDILALKQLTQDNFRITLKQTIKVYRSTVDGYYKRGITVTTTFPEDNKDNPEDSPYSILEENIEQYLMLEGQNMEYPQPSYYNNISYYGWLHGEDIAGTSPNIYYSYSPINYPIFNYSNATYSVNLTYPIGKHIEFYTMNGDLERDNNNDLSGYFTAYKYIIDEEPVSIEIGVNGVKRTINLENIKAIGEGSIDNVAEVNTYGKLLQYGLNISNPNVANEIGHITDYYENGLHTANMTVLGGVGYYGYVPNYISEFITNNYTYRKSTNSSCFQYDDIYQYWIFFADNTNATKFNEDDNIIVNNVNIDSTLKTVYEYQYGSIKMRKVKVSELYYNTIAYPFDLNGNDYVLQLRRFNPDYLPNEISFAIGFNQNIEVPLTRKTFVCGDKVIIHNYDNVSPLYYGGYNFNQDKYSLEWQITENKITFDGGAVTQALTLKELKGKLTMQSINCDNIESNAGSFNTLKTNNNDLPADSILSISCVVQWLTSFFIPLTETLSFTLNSSNGKIYSKNSTLPSAYLEYKIENNTIQLQAKKDLYTGAKKITSIYAYKATSIR